MSIEAIAWALRVPVGGNQKVCLLGLANHAHPDGSEAYPSLDTLATYAHCDRSTARRNVQKLEEAGWIVADGLGPRGQNKYRLAMGGTPSGGGDDAGGGDSPPVASAPRGGGSDATQTVPNRTGGGAAQARARARGEDDEVPPGFPDELRPHARHVMVVLRDLAERHGARAVKARALGNVMMARPRKPLVRGAHDFAAWADGKGSRQRDVVAGYRNWLDRCDDLAALEPLPGEARPLAAPAGVTPIRQARTAEERRLQRQERRMAIASGEVEPPPAPPLLREGD